MRILIRLDHAQSDARRTLDSEDRRIEGMDAVLATFAETIGVITGCPVDVVDADDGYLFTPWGDPR